MDFKKRYPPNPIAALRFLSRHGRDLVRGGLVVETQYLPAADQAIPAASMSGRSFCTIIRLDGDVTTMLIGSHDPNDRTHWTETSLQQTHDQHSAQLQETLAQFRNLLGVIHWTGWLSGFGLTGVWFWLDPWQINLWCKSAISTCCVVVLRWLTSRLIAFIIRTWLKGWRPSDLLNRAKVRWHELNRTGA